MGLCYPGDNPFQTVGGGWGVGGCGLCPKLRAGWARLSSSEVYPAGKLPFEATFAVLKRLLIVSVGTMGLCWPRVKIKLL